MASIRLSHAPLFAAGESFKLVQSDQSMTWVKSVTDLTSGSARVSVVMRLGWDL